MQGTLVIPQWPSAPFWPLFFPDESHTAECVQQILELPKRPDLFLPGQLGANVFKGPPNVAVLALRIKFSRKAVSRGRGGWGHVDPLNCDYFRDLLAEVMVTH